jgi:hypothetical protein
MGQLARKLVQEFIRIKPNHEEDRPAYLLGTKTLTKKCIFLKHTKSQKRKIKQFQINRMGCYFIVTIYFFVFSSVYSYI